jgi:TolB-like protein/Tfp pilus assembly protein PilF
VKADNFFSELKRRKVFKVGAAYLIVAWLAVQAASIGFPAFDAPPWALRIFILIAFLGFPIAVVMAWVFDITAEGVKVDASVSGNKALFAVAVLLIVLALFWYFYGQPSFRKGDVATPTTAGQNSVAVLPFVNISGKPDEDYFSDGMTEELLNVLAKIPKLNVVARTSVFEFKGKGGDVREIGRKLGVSNIVEGSVRRDREQVRVTAQLVRVVFNQAIAADPKYALAYVGLADSYLLMPLYGAGAPQDCYPKAEAAARKAIELDDMSAEAHTSLAQICCYYKLDYPQAIREFQRAIELNPNYATAHQWFGSSGLAALGRFDEAIAQVKRGIALDPLSLVINTDLGGTYYRARRYDEAIDQLRKTLEMDPNFYYAHWNLGSALMAKGAIQPAIEEYQKARALTDDPSALALLGRAYAVSGNRPEALKIRDQLEALAKQRYVSSYSLALVYLGLGDKEEALRLLEKAYQDHSGEAVRYIKVDPSLDPLRGDPRFEALVAKVFPAYTTESPSPSP